MSANVAESKISEIKRAFDLRAAYKPDMESDKVFKDVKALIRLYMAEHCKSMSGEAVAEGILTAAFGIIYDDTACGNCATTFIEEHAAAWRHVDEHIYTAAEEVTQ
ncbi:MAG: hypothetical protein CMF70_06915 [Magnetovibrio sp.]|nr:hypothetical protein [Magnetovibrio sp.]|tara:strand:- start:213 stop:530 length:318 start_codon:yes stop_codon:yes gene_type:complete